MVTTYSTIRAFLSPLKPPSTRSGAFSGAAKIFQQSLASEPFLILAALVTVFGLASGGAGVGIAFMPLFVASILIVLWGLLFMIGNLPSIRPAGVWALFGIFFGVIAVVPAWYLMVPNKKALEANQRMPKMSSQEFTKQSKVNQAKRQPIAK